MSFFLWGIVWIILAIYNTDLPVTVLNIQKWGSDEEIYVDWRFCLHYIETDELLYLMLCLSHSEDLITKFCVILP